MKIVTEQLPAIASPASATTTAATAFAAAVAEATAATGTTLLWTRFIDGQVAAFEVGAIERLDSFLRFVGIRHFDETETPRTSGELIGDYPCRLHRAVGRKQIL